MRKLKNQSLLLFFVVVSFAVLSCSKDNENDGVRSGMLCHEPKMASTNFVAEITTDSTFDRLELLDLGNIYESVWRRRHFENAEFKYDIKCTKSVFNTKFSVIKCMVDRVVIESYEGDTMVLYNVVSSRNQTSFDMRRNDSSVAHLVFSYDTTIDFVQEMQSLMSNNDAKTAFVYLPLVVGWTGPVGVAISAAALAYEIYRVECDRIIRNGTSACNGFYCGVWEGRCCVRCTGGSNHPRCNHIGAVYGNGSSCNNH